MVPLQVWYRLYECGTAVSVVLRLGVVRLWVWCRCGFPGSAVASAVQCVPAVQAGVAWGAHASMRACLAGAWPACPPLTLPPSRLPLPPPPQVTTAGGAAVVTLDRAGPGGATAFGPQADGSVWNVSREFVSGMADSWNKFW